ncbi:MAG: tetratricopeptide repeat protein [Myxococcales bacterium]|nr:MAG: tetratricopeptide repeat protein [Myxococcales bacterium]
MLRRLRLSVALAAITVGLTAPAIAFNPAGRSKKPKPEQKAPKPVGAKPAAGKPAASQPSSAKPVEAVTPPPDASGSKPEGPNREALIARYLGIVLAQPGAEFPLERLTQLYRERDGNLEKLVAELSARAAKEPQPYSTLVALGGVYKKDAQPERAIASFEQAIGKEPQNPIGLLSLAHLYADRGDKAAARARFEQALPHVKDAPTREQVLRTLMALALDDKEFAKAKGWHEQLLTATRGSFFVRAELPRELLARGELQRAVTEYEGVVKAAAGDNRVLAPALVDLGRTLAQAGRNSEAQAALDRALAISSGESGARRQILEALAEVYRRSERLPALVERLAKQAGGTEELKLLAQLYEETGQVEKALATHRKVLARDSKEVGTRLRVVRLLEVRGELDAAIAEYDSLIKSAPRNPDYVFRLTEALLQRGDRKRALAELSALEARSGSDEETLTALVDFYERMEEKDRALALLTRLAQSGSQDPEHVVELGSRYWEQGDKKKAVQTWQRLRTLLPERAEGLLRLGEVFLEHDMSQEALETLAEAVKREPKQARVRRAYAVGLERVGAAAGGRDGQRLAYEEARKIWEQILRDAAADGNAAREARQHVVTLLSLTGQLAPRINLLERKFAGSEPDLEAGRLLAEAHVRLRRYEDAERVLRRLTQLAPGNVEDSTRLERVLVLGRKLEAALATLEKLVKLDPKRAREYYQRMAGYAAELYQDDRALSYAARAVELGPDDADGHKKLGEMYEKRQDTARAIAEFRSAISKNERLFAVYLELAELLVGQGQLDEADQLFRRVVRSSPDEELVYKAARLSMQLNLGRGTLESLEKDLLPIALGNPERPIFRRLLVEVYGALAYPLLHKAKSQDAAESEEARLALRKLGERAVKPLLDALSDPREAQQQVAITLLTHVGNKDAAASLFSYASGTADPELRARAMVAVGTLRDARLEPKLTELLLGSNRAHLSDGDPVSVAAAWSLARLGTRSSLASLEKVAASDSGNLRALAVLGLGRLGDVRAIPQVQKLLRSPESGPLPRAAAAYAAGALGLRGEADALTELSRDPDPSVRAQAILALARLKLEPAAAAIAETLTEPTPELGRAAARAAVVLVSGVPVAPDEVFPVPEGALDVRRVIDAIHPAPHDPTQEIAALAKLAPSLSRAAAAAAESSPRRARALSEALSRGSGLTLGSFETASRKPKEEEQAAAQRLLADVGASVVAPLARLTTHPDPDLRLVPLPFLVGRKEDTATRALEALTRDPEPIVRRAVLSALGPEQQSLSKAVAARLGQEAEWPLRATAADALGRMTPGKAEPVAVEALTRAALTDPYALVRESALKALAQVAGRAALPTLRQLKDRDPEPRLRTLAERLSAELQ